MSQDDLVLDWFSRALLYGLPRVTVVTAGSEIQEKKTTVCALSEIFYEIQFGAS